MEINENKSGRVVVKKAKKKVNLKTFITGVLRRATLKWPARQEALSNARVERGRYRCADCGDLFGPKEIDLDHRVPVIDPKTGFKTWDDFIEKLFCEADMFDVLCKQCHTNKTILEDAMRTHYNTKKEAIPDLTSDKKYTKKKIDKKD